MNYQRYWR